MRKGIVAFQTSPSSQILLRRIPSASPISLHFLLPVLAGVDRPSAGICLEHLNLLSIHVFHDIVRLPLLEAEANALVRVVLVVSLVFVVLNLDEIGIHGGRVKG